MSEYLTTEDYEFAMHSQGACNLGGLAHALSRVVEKIQASPEAREKGTEFVNNHPIVRLYVEQMRHLCRRPYSEAYDLVADEVAFAKSNR